MLITTLNPSTDDYEKSYLNTSYSAGAGWTASGTKVVRLQGFYEAA